MVEDIKLLNKSNVENFISKYGLIKDEEMAKELLCITSNAWLVLDNSLKQNSDVIMYYQPMAICDYQVYEDMGGVFELTSDGIIAQEGFKEAKDGIQIPDIDFPKGFDIDTYINIQKELSKTYSEYRDKDVIYSDGVNMGKIMENVEFNNVTVDMTVKKFKYQEAPNANLYYRVYDRNNLNKIIKKYDANLDENEKHI